MENGQRFYSRVQDRTWWRGLIGVTALLSILLSGYAKEMKPGLVFDEDFEPVRKTGLYKLLTANKYLKVVADEGVDGSHALMATYKGSKIGSERITVHYRLGERGIEYTLNYDVKFDEDFQFVKGGKLHGLGPDKPVSGGKPTRPNGWSARLMFQAGGGVLSYLYDQFKTGQYGVGKGNWNFRLEKGKYYRVALHVRLNEKANERTGFSHIYINGECIIQQNRVCFRGMEGKESLISTFMFNTFHGGHTPDRAPKDEQGNFKDVHAYFDNISVYRGKHIR